MSKKKKSKKFGSKESFSYLYNVIIKDRKMIHFIIKRVRQTKGMKYKTFKFNTKEEGLDYLAKHNMDHRIVDILIWN